MNITEKKYTVVDGIDGQGNIHVKDVTEILKDGKPTEFKSYHRRVVMTGDDINTEDVKVKVAAAAMWDETRLAQITESAVALVTEKKAEVTAAIAELDLLIEAEKAKKADLAKLKEPAA